MSESAPSTARQVGLAALLLGASQLLSRGLGVVREMVLAWQVGAGPQTDAYRAAFQMPDLLNHFLAVGAIATAFIPLYRRALERDGERGAQRFFAVVWGTLAAGVALATVVFFFTADEFVALYFRDFDAEQQRLTVRLTRIVLPAQLAFVTGAILRGALMAHGRFAAQAAAPVVYNLCIIAGGLLGGSALGVEGFAWGALAGALLGHLLLPLADAVGRIPLSMRVAPLDPAFGRFVVLALPLVVGVTMVAGGEWLDRYFGQFVGAGAIGLLFYARALMQAPVGLVGQAVGTAALPAFAELREQGRTRELDALVGRTLQTTLTLGIGVAAALAALATPVVALLYRRGAFTGADSEQVAGLLVIFCAGIPAWVVQSVAVRPFHARGDTWRPMLLGTGVLLLAVPLYALVSPRYGAPGLAASGTIAICLNAIATLGLARVLHGAPSLGSLAGSALRAVVVAGLAGGAAFAVSGPVGGWVGSGALGALSAIVAGGLAYCLVALPLAWRFADAPTRALLARSLRRAAPPG